MPTELKSQKKNANTDNLFHLLQLKSSFHLPKRKRVAVTVTVVTLTVGH